MGWWWLTWKSHSKLLHGLLFNSLEKAEEKSYKNENEDITF